MTDTAIPRREVCLPAPRHREIRGRLAKHIMRSRVTARRGRLGCGREKTLRSEAAHGVFRKRLSPQHTRI